MMKVGIIGCGAAGMMAAYSASNNGHDVIVFEHGLKPGKKILATGNGKCNFTNANISEENYNNDGRSLFSNVYSKLTNEDTINLFEEIGISPYLKNGYYYPRSEQASSVVTCLNNAIISNNVKIIYECNIKCIEKNDTVEEIVNTITKNPTNKTANKSANKSIHFILHTDKGIYEVDKLIIAAGSNISEKTGSDGSGFIFAKEFGHTIKEPVPALCGLKCKGADFKKVSGVRCQANVALFIDKKHIKSDNGELQLTDYGISGIPVFQISADALRGNLEKRNVSVLIDLMPEVKNENIVKELLINRRNQIKNTSIESFFDGLFNYKIGNMIFDQIKDNPLRNIEIKKCADISDKVIDEMAFLIKNFNVEVIGHRGFENAQVCSGGVLCSELKNTLESKLCDGLYFAGEIIDVNGDCGGYNLQWAWSSGYVAGMLN